MLRFILPGLLLFLSAASVTLQAQVVIAFQGGEGTPADNWNIIPISNVGGPLPPGVVSIYPKTGSYSIRAGGGNNVGCSSGINCIAGGQAAGCPMHGKIIEFVPVNVACLDNVQLSVSHRSHIFCSGGGFDSGERLSLEVSINGGGWTVVGVVGGFSDYAWDYTTNPAGHASSGYAAIANPFVYNVPAGTNTIAFRARGYLNRSDEVFYIDDVQLTTTTVVYNFPGSDGLWNGAVNTDWHNACNWDSRMVPTAGTDVFLSNTAFNICEVLPGNTAACRELWIDMSRLAVESFTSTINVAGSLVIGPDGVLDMSLAGTEGGTLNLQGDFVNMRDETYFEEGRSTVNFTGANNQLINTWNDTREVFYKMGINKPSGLLTTNEHLWLDPLNVAGAVPVLSLSGGVLDLNGRALKVWNDNPIAVSRTGGGVISERADHTSLMTRVTNGNAGNFLFPFIKSTGSYIPFTYVQTAGNAGAVTASTYPTTPDNQPWPVSPLTVLNLNSSIGLAPDNRDATVDRFWQVDVTGSSTADLTFTYDVSELPVAPYNNPNTIGAQRYDAPTEFWQPYLPGQSAAPYTVTVPGVTEFSVWTLTNNLSPLPVSWLYFHAMMNDGGAVDLDWATASEINNNYFTVQKSRDGMNFEPFVSVAGMGNSTQVNEYRAIDNNPFDGVSYYRLKQTDYDGNKSYSPLVRINNRSTNSPTPVLFPNPAAGYFYLLADDVDASMPVRIFDIRGQFLMELKSDAERSAGNLLFFQRPALSAGVYLLFSGEGKVVKLVLE